MKIIGAGFPRTGTTSLKRSLEILGYSKTYHMKELLYNPTTLPYWLSLEETGTTDWDGLYDGFQASVDFPAYPFYKEHLAKYPDAKIILTVRPFDKWYASVSSTIRKAGPQTLPEKLVMMSRMLTNSHVRNVVKCIKFVKRMLWEKQFEGKFEDKAHVEMIFNRHIEEVKANVPADKLLIYDVRDGWGPLCDFLGVPEPPEPLPHLNKKENFKTMLSDILDGKRA